MLDIKWIEAHPDLLDKALESRGEEPRASRILAVLQKRRALITRLQNLQKERNDTTALIAQAMHRDSSNVQEISATSTSHASDTPRTPETSCISGISHAHGQESSENAPASLSSPATTTDELQERPGMALKGSVASLKESMQCIKQNIQNTDDEQKEAQNELDKLMDNIPNIPLPNVPFGRNDEENIELRRWGKPREFTFTPRHHYEIGQNLGLLDFEQAAKMSGARFSILKGELAQLERALRQFMLETHTQKFGYEEVAPPLLVRSHTMYGTAQLPKFAYDQFATQNDLWLIPTGEVPLTNLVQDTILKEEDLPLRYVACTPCFRLEAGAAGKDTRGIVRQHQFYKVELVGITTPQQDLAEQERMVSCAAHIIEALEIPYRVLVLCTGDMGFSSRRTYDLEIWLPAQNTFREISSCSTCGSFQARRMKARYRTAVQNGETLEFVHTLNGSGLAVGRALVAVLENYQQEDGSVVIPEVLRSYMNGQSVIPTKTHRTL